MFKNYKYLLASFSMAGYCFSVTGLQYFFTDYILTAINEEESRALVYTAFFCCALVAPAMGSMLAR